MPLLIINYIRQHWRTAILLLIVVIISTQHLYIKHLDRKLAEYKSVNVMMEDSNKKLNTSLAAQNAAVAALQTASKRKTGDAAKALVKVQSHAKQYAEKRKNINAIKITGNECADMKNLLDSFFQN